MTEPKVYNGDIVEGSQLIINGIMYEDFKRIHEKFILKSDYDKLKQQLERAEKVIREVTDLIIEQKYWDADYLLEKYFTEKESGE